MPAHPRNVVGPQLRRLRNERGLSQTALAARCQRKGWDAGRDIIKHIEAQVRAVRDVELVLLASVLGVAPANLLPESSKGEKLARSALASSG
jgi:transcriptional regulator with XRE-family HTH domain